jgi:hypothetical protein
MELKEQITRQSRECLAVPRADADLGLDFKHRIEGPQNELTKKLTARNLELLAEEENLPPLFPEEDQADISTAEASDDDGDFWDKARDTRAL